MMRKSILMFFLILCFSCTYAQKNEVQVVLLAGQSNMAGHGNYDELDASIKERIEKVKFRVLLSTNEKGAEPLSFYISKENKKYNFTKSFGPEIFIGLTLAEKYPDKNFLLIKKAVGGTSLYGAWSARWTQEKANIAEFDEDRKKLRLYSSFTNLVHHNLSALKASGKTYKIWGMCWMQGESDTNKAITAQSYKANLDELIASCRKEFGDTNMPFVIGQINCKGRKYPEGPIAVRKAMEAVANADNYVGIVKTSFDFSWSDFPKHADDLHYTALGQKRLGVAFANELIAKQ